MTNTDPPKDPLVLLWQIARMWIADAIDAFGAPGEIAALIAAHARRAVKRRIKALETLVMKLLLIEAGKLAGVTHTHAMGCGKNLRAARACVSPPLPPLDPATPEAWRVRFALRIPPEARPPWTPPANSGPRIRDLGRPLLVRDIWREQAHRAHLEQLARARLARFMPDEARERAKAAHLARRFEALRRAVANPAPYARQLLRKLNALEAHAYDAAMRVAMALPPPKQLNPLVIARAEFHACTAVPAVLAAALDSS